MTDADSRRYDAYGVAVVYVGAKSCKASGFFGTDVYTEYTFRLSAACLGKVDEHVYLSDSVSLLSDSVDGHVFRVRYSQARRAHDKIAQSALFSDRHVQKLGFPPSFPLRDMKAVDCVNERAADLCAYYNRLVASEGALASSVVRRTMGLGPVTEAAVLTAAELYFGSVFAVKQRFVEIGDTGADSCADHDLHAQLSRAISLGTKLLLDSREDIARCTGMPIMADEDGVRHQVRSSLSAVAPGSQHAEFAAVEWASFETWWKAACFQPLVAATRRALGDHGSTDPRHVARRLSGEELVSERNSSVSNNPEAELERVQALLSAESQARQQAQADLEEMGRLLAHERTQRMDMQQRQKEGAMGFEHSALSEQGRFLKSSPDVALAEDSGLSTNAVELGEDPPPEWKPRTDSGRILPSPSNLLNESRPNLGVHLSHIPAATTFDAADDAWGGGLISPDRTKAGRQVAPSQNWISETQTRTRTSLEPGSTPRLPSQSNSDQQDEQPPILKKQIGDAHLQT